MQASRIAGTGSYLPAQVLTNDELAQRVDTSDEWIRTRTGIRAAPHRRRRRDRRSDLALARVARRARRRGHRAGRRRSHHRRDDHARHDLPVDGVHPAGEARRARRPGVRRAGGVHRASSTRSRIADQMVASGVARNALVVGAEIYSRILDWNDRGTACCSATAPAPSCWCRRASPGILARICTRTAAIATSCACPGTLQDGEVTGTPFVRMDGPAVFKFAVKVLAEVGARGARRQRRRRCPRSTG